MSKRGRNEGSIHRRKDGRWAGAADLGWQEGKRLRRYVYGATRAEARDKLNELLRKHQNQLPIPSERETVGKFLTRWLEESVKTTVRPRTYLSYRDNVGRHIEPSLGKVRLSRLGPREIQELLNQKLASGLSPRTVQYLHAILRRALGQAYRWGLIARNVATLVNPPQVTRPEVRPLDPDQAKVLLETVSGHRLEALYSVALAIGLRQGEALGLRWNDVEFEAQTITVRATLQKIDGEFQLMEPKTARSRRTIALPQIAVDALRTHRIRQRKERLLAGSKWTENGLVFTTSIGTPLDTRNVTQRLQKLLVDAGLPKLRFHDLRHTAATLLLAQGVHPRVVMEILGHSQIRLTMDTYSHVIPALQRDAAGKMDAMLR